MTAQASPTRLPVHPDRVRAVLDARLGDATVARLIACERLRGRTDALLDRGERAETDGAPVPADAPAWLLADPAEAARRAGTVLHGRAIREVVSAAEVAALIAAIGREAHAVGLRQGAREDAGQGVLAPSRENGGDLAGAILRDGHACLGAWLAGQSSGLRRAALLALPPGTPAEADGADPELCGQAETVMAQVARSYDPDDTRGAHG